MRLKTKDVNFPGGISVDGWEVLLGGGIVCIVVGALAKGVRFLIAVGVALIVLWVITVFLVGLGILKPIGSKGPREGGGPAAADGLGGPGQPTPPKA